MRVNLPLSGLFLENKEPFHCFVSFFQIYCLIYISIQAHYVPRLNNELVHKHDIHIFSRFKTDLHQED